MLDQDTKRKIDSARDILVGKVPDPKAHKQTEAGSIPGDWDIKKLGELTTLMTKWIQITLLKGHWEKNKRSTTMHLQKSIALLKIRRYFDDY